MIFGIFGGTTPATLASRIDRLQTQRDAIQESLSQAVADRASAIDALKNELAELAVIGKRL